MKHVRVLLMGLLLLSTAAAAQVRLNKPRKFPKTIPAGNYSGITPIGEGRYAVVDDKAAGDGFSIFRLDIDSLTGKIRSAANEGFFPSGQPNRDMEGICYFPSAGTLFISGEADNEVYEYRLDGQRTGRRLAMPDCFKTARSNRGLEALTYNAQTHLFWTTSEQPLPGDTLLRLQSFGDDLLPRHQYFYRPDAPVKEQQFHGVSALCALDDGRLLVLEREIYIPKKKVGAKTYISIYAVQPSEPNAVLEKTLITAFTTRLTLTGRKYANYEGLCQPFPGILLLIADSQNRYKGVLRDWFRTIVVTAVVE